MSKHGERERARTMRGEGYTYTEILAELAKDGKPVSRGSLSNWLKGLELTPEQQARIKAKECDGRNKGIATIVKTRAAKNENKMPTAGFPG